MVSEKRKEQEIQLEAPKQKSLLFKNNVGSAYRGKPSKHKGQLILTNLQFIQYGLGGIKGGSDQIGITDVVVTPEMVGKTLGVFTAIEVKKDKHGAYKATDPQIRFIDMVKSHGGIAGVCDCVEDFVELITEFRG